MCINAGLQAYRVIFKIWVRRSFSLAFFVVLWLHSKLSVRKLNFKNFSCFWAKSSSISELTIYNVVWYQLATWLCNGSDTAEAACNDSLTWWQAARTVKVVKSGFLCSFFFSIFCFLFHSLFCAVFVRIVSFFAAAYMHSQKCDFFGVLFYSCIDRCVSGIARILQLPQLLTSCHVIFSKSSAHFFLLLFLR